MLFLVAPRIIITAKLVKWLDANNITIDLQCFIHFPICFRAVHSVCLWDDKGPQKVYQALQDDILEFIRQAQAVSDNLFIKRNIRNKV